MDKNAAINIGEIIRHKILDYRGVVVDIDPMYMLTAECAEDCDLEVYRRPWYKILVDQSPYETYVAQENLELDYVNHQPIRHPDIGIYFCEFCDGKYKCCRPFH